jgi:CheY-like chemotaxis protein
MKNVLAKVDDFCQDMCCPGKTKEESQGMETDVSSTLMRFCKFDGLIEKAGVALRAEEVVKVDTFNVLLVDDEVEFLETLVKRLKRRNLSVTAVHSGEEALESLAQCPVDVVVLDVKMPGMGGLETLKEIKKRCPLVEVIMLTGHASMEVAIEGMEVGAFDYLMKPMDIDELLYKLQDAYKKKTLHEDRIRHAVDEVSGVKTG